MRGREGKAEKKERRSVCPIASPLHNPSARNGFEPFKHLPPLLRVEQDSDVQIPLHFDPLDEVAFGASENFRSPEPVLHIGVLVPHDPSPEPLSFLAGRNESVDAGLFPVVDRRPNFSVLQYLVDVRRRPSFAVPRRDRRPGRVAIVRFHEPPLFRREPQVAFPLPVESGIFHLHLVLPRIRHLFRKLRQLSTRKAFPESIRINDISSCRRRQSCNAVRLDCDYTQS